MKPLILSLLFVVVLTGGWFIYFNGSSSDESVETVNTNVSQDNTKTNPSFSWRFEEADTHNLDGNPQTHIFITAQYDTNSSEKMIDTVDGGCSVLDAEDGVGETRVQCYYAGLGQRYRVVQDNGGFIIERQLFEEAMPDAVPAEYEWESIARF